MELEEKPFWGAILIFLSPAHWLEVKCGKEGGKAAIACKTLLQGPLEQAVGGTGVAEKKGFLGELAKASRETHYLFQTENRLRHWIIAGELKKWILSPYLSIW